MQILLDFMDNIFATDTLIIFLLWLNTEVVAYIILGWICVN